MPSNEVLELLESVLSESKAFRKYSDQVQKKIEKLADDYATAKDSGDKDAIRKATKALNDYNSTLAKYGMPYPTTQFGIKSPEVYDKDIAKSDGEYYKKLDKNFKMNTGSARPSKNIAGHANINARTFATTGKLEAACILIEALNTLLNE